jgi:hypothetical protein
MPRTVDAIIDELANPDPLANPRTVGEWIPHRAALGHAACTGPTITTPRHDGPGRYRPHRRKVLQEYAVELEPGLDPETWSDAVIEDSHGDWNKVGGTACWLQGAEVPDGATFAFQFSPSAFGYELGDGAEAYAFVGGDGRGAWLWQCH